ncbi:hypothetical protein C4K38_3146 [Pseudomonas chlororaphis subsp. piscium]|nr:hypothetical protein C4K38_3146 [Pseudomonas chlororaphis subsp. piscium]SDT00734.1 hypothetical protein SAMN05216585_4234 [Pseudomonas chlororaphis]
MSYSSTARILALTLTADELRVPRCRHGQGVDGREAQCRELAQRRHRFFRPAEHGQPCLGGLPVRHASGRGILTHPHSKAIMENAYE